MRQTKLRVIITTLLMSIFFAVNGFGATPVFATGTKTVTTPPSATKADLVANDPSYTSSIECSALKTNLEGYGSLYPFTSWPYGTLNQFKVNSAPPTTWTDYTNISNAPVSSPKISIKRTSNSIEWTSNFGIDFVLVKGGTNGTNIYIYVPSGNSGGSLTTPGAQGISHVTFCWDNPAKIKIDKSTSPDASDNVDFDFTLKIPNYLKNGSSFIENFELSDSDGIKTFTDLPKGNFDLNEILTSAEESQWATSVVCTLKRNGSTSTIVNSNEDETIDLDGVLGGDEISCTFTNMLPTRSIKFVKKEYGSNTLLNGWKIQVKDQNGTVIKEGTTGEDGTGVVIIDNIPFGTYTYCEVLQAGWGIHSPAGGCFTDTIDSSTPTGSTSTDSVGTQTYGGSYETFTFYNKKVRSIKFIKKEYGTYALLNGWTIKVLKSDGTPFLDANGNPVQGVTGANGDGTVIISGLPFGTYKYCEVLQSGWAIHSPSGGCYTDTIDSYTGTGTTATATESINTQTYGGSGIDTFYFYNKKAVRSIRFIKKEYGTNTLLNGWTIQVKNQAGTVIKEGTTGDDGTGIVIIDDIPFGTYTYCEVLDGHPGWLIQSPAGGCFTDTIDSNTPTGTSATASDNLNTQTYGGDGIETYYFFNKKAVGSLKVTKSVNWSGVTPDTGKTFQICITGPSYSSPNCKTFDYDGGDQTWTNLLPGSYTVTETSPGSNWTVSGSGVTVNVVADQTATKTVTNTHKLGSLKVTKSVNWNGVTPDTGKTFEICITGPSYPTTPSCKTYTHNGGDQTWANLIPGTYTVTETNPGSNWTVSGSGVTASVVADQTASKTVTNTHKLGSLKVTKSVNWSSVTQDTSKTFEICITGPSYPTTPNCKTFDYDGGDQTWTNLIPGTYTVTETNPGANWTVSGSGVTVSVVADQTATKTVTNTHKVGSLKVTKSVNWNGVTPDTGKTFEICITGPSYSSPNCKTFDHDGGDQTWTNLIPGTYTVTETSPGSNWTVSGSGVTVSVVADQTASKTVTNTHNVGSLKVTKSVVWNGVTPDTGKTFQICITGPSYPTTPNCKTFDYDGGFEIWSNLIPGTYTVSETDPGSNEWKVPVIGGSSNVVSGQTAYATVKNERKIPGIDIKKYTNGYDADAANGSLGIVPKIAPNATVTWTYIVSNTGSVSFPKASVVVTDNLKDIPVANSVVPVYVSELFGNGDANFDPGERWLYRAVGTALDLVAQGSKSYIVNGCQTGEGINRPTYENYGYVKITGTQYVDHDPSHYCNPETPGIDITKFTNGYNANMADGSQGEVPKVPAGQGVTWTYLVTNTGNVPFLKASVVVTDNRGVAVTFDKVVSPLGSDDAVLSPGEVWQFKATGNAVDLVLNSGATYVVNGCQTGQGIGRPTYNNTGFVKITGYSAQDNDPSHYCNPETPGIDITKFTNGYNANAADGSQGEVPKVPAGQGVTWTYLVTNTGNVPFLKASVVVTDNRGVAVTFETVVSPLGSDDAVMSPGEVWQFKATGNAVDLVMNGGAAYVVNGCQTGQGIDRPTYNNTGFVKITGYSAQDNDPSHYCNPETPGIDITKFTNGYNANMADGSQGEVPKVPAGQGVTWTYLVTNTGNVPFPAASVVVTDNRGVAVTFEKVVVGSGPDTLNPGDTWQYKATGNAVDLVLNSGAAYVVNGCQTGQGIARPTYNNTGFVKITGYSAEDNDPSHYCNPETPSLEIKKYTNGFDADDPNGSDVPRIEPDGSIEWTYVVSNTGNVPYDFDDVDVTDDQGVVPAFVGYLAGDTDDNFEPGERWLYKASGTAVKLELNPQEGIVEGCRVQETITRPTYNNTGMVSVENGPSDTDESHYCNPYKPGIFIKKYTNGFDADTPTGPVVAVGSTVTWTYYVTNTGDVPLSNVVVTDNIAGVTPVYIEGDTNGDQKLDLTEKWLFRTTGIAVAGQYANIGTTKGTPPEGKDVTDDDPSHYFANDPTVAALGDRVWHDLNRNGLQDQGEPGVPNVTVNLLAGDCTTPMGKTDVTDSNGIYGFGQLVPGDYCVEFDLTTRPTGFSVTTQNANSNSSDASDSDGDPTTGKTQSVNLPGGTENLTLDLGIYEPAALGDRVWFDQNANGVQDQGEPGVPNVTVNLLAGDCSTSMNQSTTTNGDGIYGFINLTPGDYCVQFDLTTLPTGFKVTTQNVGDDTTDSDGDPTSGKTQSVNLPSGTENLTLDLGIYEPASLGDRVWHDLNWDGVQDDGEPGVAGVTVKLLTTNCTVETGMTTVTNGDGIYGFTNLTPGSYCVQFDLTTLPTGFSVTTQNANSNSSDASDSDGDLTTGKTQSVSLPSGGENLTLDLGIFRPATLGNRVWEDTNKNGTQDNGEANVPGVKVTLYNCNDQQVGQPAVTDENGNYLFTDLMPGCYYVIFDPTTLPPGYTFTTPDGSGDDVDSDADPTTGKTPSVTIKSGDNYVDLDAGIVAPNQPALAALGDTVWYDVDKDGIQDGGEAGVPGVKVDLYTSDGTFVATQNTNASGKYLFSDLQPGSYYVEFATVQGYVYTRYNVNANGQDALDSDPPMPWLDVTIDDGGDPAVKGEPLTYTFFYTNTDSTLAATNVVISTTIPTGTTFEDSLSNAGWNCPNSAAGTVCTLTVATLNGNASGSAAFTVIVDENAPNVPLDIFTTVTQSTLARTQVVTLAAGQTNLTLDAGLVVIGSSLTTPTPTDPTNIPGGEQPNQRKSIFLPTVQYQQ